MAPMKSLSHLRPGDRVGVIAPAGPPAPERMALVEPLLARYGLRAKIYPSCHARHPQHGYLAGDDALRLADLYAAFADDDVGAVFCARGGYGCTRLLDALDVGRLVAHRKPFVGYSDITALHAVLQSQGELSFHAPMAASDLVVEGAGDDADALFALLMHPLRAGHVFAPDRLEGGWQVGGRASGRLVGGNLSLIAALAGTRWALDARGAIVFIEDVSEALYRVDRLMTQLRHTGLLDVAAGFLLGSFTEDADPVHVVREHLSRFAKPVLAGWPAGHGRPNRALPLGAHVTLDAGAGTLTLQDTVLE